jgi:hypothetical protein
MDKFIITDEDGNKVDTDKPFYTERIEAEKKVKNLMESRDAGSESATYKIKMILES